jgi:hypothetical protein
MIAMSLTLALASCAPYCRTYVLVRTPYRISVQNWCPKSFAVATLTKLTLTVVSAKAWHYVHIYD